MAWLLGQEEGEKKDGEREVRGRDGWVAVWERARGVKIFAKHMNVPQEAATIGGALNLQTGSKTQPADFSLSLCWSDDT